MNGAVVMLRLSINVTSYAVAVVLVVAAVRANIATPLQAPETPRHLIELDNGWEVAYLQGGDESLPIVLYVHGTPGSSHAFRDYVANPIPGTQAISIDRPGFGETIPNEPTGVLAEHVEALEPFLKKRGGRWPILVGHSMGAPIIALAAMMYPERVAGLVIISGAMDPALEKIFWYQYLAESGTIPYALPESIVHSNRELFPYKSELEAMQPRLNEIACPIVIIHAKDDFLVPFSNVEYMKDRFTARSILSIEELDAGDHFLLWNSTDIVRGGIQRVLDSP